MCLNHPKTITMPTPLYGKIVFHRTSPWCQKRWVPLLYGQVITSFITEVSDIFVPECFPWVQRLAAFLNQGPPTSQHNSMARQETTLVGHLMAFSIPK